MRLEKRITGSTRLAGVIGNPIEHSVSPQLHNTISKGLGINLTYMPFLVEKENLEQAVKGLRALNAVGFNITIPYKKDVMKFIDVNTKESLLMGAVNTVKNIDGRLYGYNTDAEGFSRSFKEGFGMGFKEKKVLLIGAGGTARSIAVKLALEGARQINIVNRTAEKANDIAEIVNNNVSRICRVYDSGTAEREGVFGQSDIIINTTPLGMYPNTDASPISDELRLREGQAVYDVIYNPGKTKFLKQAEKNGCRISNGFGMLIYQGIFAYEIWTGIKVPEQMIQDVFKAFSNVLK